MTSKACILDLDGTLYEDGVAYPGVVECCNRAAIQGWHLIYASNNTSKPIKEYEHKLQQLGFPVQQAQIITPLVPLCEWIKQTDHSTAYILGKQSVVDSISAGSGINIGLDADLVVVCYDTELTYDKISRACALINKGVPWVQTHIDETYPSKNGPMPDCGLLSEMIERTTNVLPKLDFGKPSDAYVSSLKQCINMEVEELYMVGDRIKTDMKTALKVGATPILISSEYDENLHNSVSNLSIYESAVKFFQTKLTT
jgi:HAD superfamily hydrolase (TIGR01450 family)